jgi:hypothetical protein
MALIGCRLLMFKRNAASDSGLVKHSCPHLQLALCNIWTRCREFCIKAGNKCEHSVFGR